MTCWSQPSPPCFLQLLHASSLWCSLSAHPGVACSLAFASIVQDRPRIATFLASNNEQVLLLRIPRQSLAADALQSQNTYPIIHTYLNPSQGTEEMEGYQVEDTQQTVTNFIH